MNKKLISIILLIVIFNILTGSSLIDKGRNFINLSINTNDSLIKNQNGDISNLDLSKNIFKSPGKALLYSGILPGMGQLYLKKWMRGMFFVVLDGFAISTWYLNNDLAEQKKVEYAQYATENWEFSNWIHDYYYWEPSDPPSEFLGGQESWDSIREAFVNKSDTIAGCIEYPYCYTDIWDHSHTVEFTWNGEIISSSQRQENRSVFIEKYDELCGDNSYINERCENSLEKVKAIMSENGVHVIKDHHFFEGIQKYDMFFAGWIDNDTVEVVIKSHGDINVTSPNQRAYRKLWNDYNAIKTLAGNGGKFMLINRAISMVDAILLAKKWNNMNETTLSLSAYPNLMNKSGLGGIKLSIYFK